MLTIENEESHASDMTFEDLFKQYYAYAVKQIIWIVKDQSIAEELAQEVFLQLYRSDWKAIENIPGWLIKSSTYVAYNHLRSEKGIKRRLIRKYNTMTYKMSHH